MAKSKRARRQFTTQQKADVLRRRMIEKVPVSDLCNELSTQPSCSPPGSGKRLTICPRICSGIGASALLPEHRG